MSEMGRQGEKRERGKKGRARNDSSVGLSEGVRMAVPLREAKTGGNQQREVFASEGPAMSSDGTRKKAEYKE